MTSGSLLDRRSGRRSPAPVGAPWRAPAAVSLVVGLVVASLGGVVVALWERSGTPIPPPQPMPSGPTVDDWPDGGIVYLDYPAVASG
ncbi:MAG: hypothetical protein ICV70_01315 [Jiangellaceae bacterium]|nr:hypothetical protein [Jiangellaceae bacterium]